MNPEASPASVPVSEGAESVSNVGLATSDIAALADAAWSANRPSRYIAAIRELRFADGGRRSLREYRDLIDLALVRAGDEPPYRREQSLAVRAAQIHLDSLADTGDAYTSFHGWVLTCLWCSATARGRTKTEAVAGMQEHYDRVCEGRAGVIR